MSILHLGLTDCLGCAFHLKTRVSVIFVGERKNDIAAAFSSLISREWTM